MDDSDAAAVSLSPTDGAKLAIPLISKMRASKLRQQLIIIIAGSACERERERESECVHVAAAAVGGGGEAFSVSKIMNAAAAEIHCLR